MYAGRTKWLRSIKESLNNSSLICTANSTQILGYLMRKLEQYKEQSSAHSKEAVVVTGLQSYTAYTKIWVLNERTHVDGGGKYIHPSQSPYIWLAKYLPQSEKTPFNIPLRYASSAVPKKRTTAVKRLVDCLRISSGDNFPVCLLLLGAEVLCVHYEALIDVAHQVRSISFSSVPYYSNSPRFLLQ